MAKCYIDLNKFIRRKQMLAQEYAEKYKDGFATEDKEKFIDNLEKLFGELYEEMIFDMAYESREITKEVAEEYLDRYDDKADMINVWMGLPLNDGWFIDAVDSRIKNKMEEKENDDSAKN